MYRFCLILLAAVALTALSAGYARAADDGSTDTLSAYLHAHRLPLVEARMLNGEHGERSVLLYGFVATQNGKLDAEDQARDFLDDPDITIINRIKVRPELLTLGRPANSETAAQSNEESADEESAANADQTATQTEEFPDAIGNQEDYANQERDAELLMSNGASLGGIPLALAILGSGSVFPPVRPDPIYFYRVPPAFGPPPIVVSTPPVIVMRPPYSAPPTVFRGFPAPGPGYFPSPFPAGPAPMFPATGGAPPFPTTIGPGFGGFAGPGFSSPGFGGGGFGGHAGFGGGFGGRH